MSLVCRCATNAPVRAITWRIPPDNADTTPRSAGGPSTLPQHATAPDTALAAHENWKPVATAVTGPRLPGGVAMPYPLFPQHDRLPDNAWIAQAWYGPNDSAVAVPRPAGGVARLSALLPQHATAPEVLIAQVKSPPARTTVAGPRLPGTSVWRRCYSPSTTRCPTS